MSDHTETAILAGGCFWGVQELLRRRDGVISTRVGYTGGENENPTYRNHPGHAEAVEIVFDPMRISYRDILELFFQIHDPTTKNRQGNDIGSDYRSEIFCATDEQRRVADDTIADVEASGLCAQKDPRVRSGGSYAIRSRCRWHLERRRWSHSRSTRSTRMPAARAVCACAPTQGQAPEGSGSRR